MMQRMLAGLFIATFARGADVTLPPHSETVLMEAATTDIPLRDLKLREAGLHAAPLFPKADEIRVFKDKTAINASPAARIWINAAQTNRYWFHTGGEGSINHVACAQYVVRDGLGRVFLHERHMFVCRRMKNYRGLVLLE